MGLLVKLGGVNITPYVDEMTIQIVDALGQGAGAGGGGVGRAGTASFLTTLGPLSQARGAGTGSSTPKLVRQGEILIYDAGNNLIYGGYAAKYQDVTEKTTILTKVDCVDYWQHLDRIVVNEIYDGNTDIFMIRDLLTKYAPTFNQSKLPTRAAFTFGTKNYRHFTLQQALNDICGVSGYQMWVDTSKHVYYESPASARQSSFGLSDTPDFRSSFPCQVVEDTLDDTAAINRVYFYGGKAPTGDFVQNISTQANSANTVFTLAYYPREASDGKIHVTVNGTDLVLGLALGSGAKNILKSKGGLADVLIDASAQTLTFNIAPTTGALVTCKYRYQTPLVVVLTNQASHQLYGMYLDGVITDNTIFDKPTAVARCQTLLLEQALGLEVLKVNTWTPGLRAGYILKLTHSIRKINRQFIIQQVTTTALGAGNFKYEIQLGAWNWNFVDILVQAAKLATPLDSEQDDVTVQLDVVQIPLLYPTHSAFTVTTHNYPTGTYYATRTALGDGKDAYCGYSSLLT